MIEFKYAGKAFNLQKYMKDKAGGFEKAMAAVLEEAEFDGTFTITPHSIGRGSTATRGVLRFGASKTYGRGLPCAYHPTNLDNGCNILFTLSCVPGMDEMSFLAKLKSAQMTHKEPTLDQSLKHEEKLVRDIASDQTTLSLLVSALRDQVSSLGAEYLTIATVNSCIVGVVSCEVDAAPMYINQLVELGILQSSGKGGRLYAVSANKKVDEISSASDTASSAADMTKFLTELPKTIKRATELKAELPKLQAALREKTGSLERCRQRIPALESEIAELHFQIESATSFLNSDGVQAAIQFAEITKALQA